MPTSVSRACRLCVGCVALPVGHKQPVTAMPASRLSSVLTLCVLPSRKVPLPWWSGLPARRIGRTIRTGPSTTSRKNRLRKLFACDSYDDLKKDEFRGGNAANSTLRSSQQQFVGTNPAVSSHEDTQALLHLFPCGICGFGCESAQDLLDRTGRRTHKVKVVARCGQ